MVETGTTRGGTVALASRRDCTRYSIHPTLSRGVIDHKHPLHFSKRGIVRENAIHTLTARRASLPMAELTPARCRFLSGPAPRTGDFKDPEGLCRPGFAIPADPHCGVHPEKPQQSASASLVRLLRGRRLLFIGDSISGQVANALECAIRRDASLEVFPAIKVAGASALANACGQLWDATRHSSSASKAFEDSNCRALGMGTFASRAHERKETFLTLHGTSVPRFNFTFFRKFGDVYHYDRPTSVRVPTHLELVRSLDLADVVVLNFGLHYGNESRYQEAMRAALHALDDFAATAPGRAAVFRETSAQHFPAASGDYHDAVRRDPALVLAPPPQVHPPTRAAGSVGARGASGFKAARGSGHAGAGPAPQRQWTGPSMCQEISDAAPPHWRNAVVSQLFREGRFRHVRLQPMESLTKPRWAFHASTKWVGGAWKSDCTHWCYSPCFWDGVISDMHTAIASSLSTHADQQQAKRRHRQREGA